MSYILDALRKADAERERDPARGIHAQPAVLPADASSRFPSWIPVAAAAVAVLGAGAAWFMRPAASPSAPAVLSVAPAPISTALPAPAPVLHEAPPAAAPQVVQVAATVSPPAPPPLAAPERVPAKPPVAQVVKAAPAAVPATPAVPAAAAAPVAKPVVPAAKPAVAVPAVAAAAPAPAADRILTVAELPPDVQQSLPKLQISGGVYSDNAAQRMLIVGGQVMNEGAQLAPGAVLEQIKPHAAILKFRGFRYSVAY